MSIKKLLQAIEQVLEQDNLTKEHRQVLEEAKAKLTKSKTVKEVRTVLLKIIHLFREHWDDFIDFFN